MTNGPSTGIVVVSWLHDGLGVTELAGGGVLGEISGCVCVSGGVTEWRLVWLAWRGLSKIDSCLHGVVQFLLSVPGQFLKRSIE